MANKQIIELISNMTIVDELGCISIGHTRIIRGEAVTRWAENSFEVSTWGRCYFDIHKTADRLA